MSMWVLCSARVALWAESSISCLSFEAARSLSGKIKTPEINYGIRGIRGQGKQEGEDLESYVLCARS